MSFYKKSRSKKIGIGTEGKIQKDFGLFLRWIESGHWQEKQAIAQKANNSVDFFNAVAKYQHYKLRCVVWSYMPFGEKRTAVTASLLWCKGTKNSFADYLFIKKGFYTNTDFMNSVSAEMDFFHWLETKSPSREKIVDKFSKRSGKMELKVQKISAGKQSEGQIAFQNMWKDSANSTYDVVESLEQAIEFLIQKRILVL